MRVICIIAVALCCAATTVAQDTLTLTLDEAIAIALQHNFDVRLARQDSLLAINTGETSITGFLPTVNLNGATSTGKTDLRQKMADGRLISKDQAGITNLNGGATLSWVLFDGLGMFASRDKLDAMKEQGLARVRATMQTVIADVVTAYYYLVANQQYISTVDSAMVLAVQRFEIAEQQYSTGLYSGVELSQARIDLNSQKALSLKLHADEANASSALLTLLGRSQQAIVLTNKTSTDQQVPPVATLIRDLDSLNPDVMALQKALEAASAHVRETNAAFFPQLGVSASYQFNRTNQDAGFVLQNQTAGWNLGAQLQWNIFNGFADNLARERALIQVERAAIDIESLRNELKGRLDRTYRSYATATEQLELEQASYSDALQNASVAVSGLRIGTVSAIEVRQALLTLLQVGENIAQRAYERRLAATELLRLTGRLVR